MQLNSVRAETEVKEDKDQAELNEMTSASASSAPQSQRDLAARLGACATQFDSEQKGASENAMLGSAERTITFAYSSKPSSAPTSTPAGQLNSDSNRASENTMPGSAAAIDNRTPLLSDRRKKEKPRPTKSNCCVS